MSFASIRIITDDVDALTAFYETVTRSTAARPSPLFAQFSGGDATLAIASPQTVAMLGDGVATAANRSVIVEFEVADVDGEFARIAPDPSTVALAPSTMPWGNRSALLRDPDGNLVNLFSRPAS
ncbi:VOC family protein [Schumannella soli]|uniref:VOC family protein n=1 Tax=Schumannella soli TaxID=2590779 RepID=A0A506Y3E3_9MICO|nr:VOC family protein [Schumannella soli]TPW76453.1 VOC family protein [Schumannella soli]